MSPDNLREAAKNGDLLAISNLVQQAFTPQEICIEAEIQFGVTLWLKLRSNDSLNYQNCLNVISRTLNSIKPEKIVSEILTETSSKDSRKQVWNKYCTFKQGKLVDNITAANERAYAFFGLFLGLFILMLIYGSFIPEPTSTASVTSKPTSTASTSSPSTVSRIFIGKSHTGYELWADKSCVYVKGITEADLARLNTNVRDFKDAVKVQTGYQCVLFE